MNLAGNIATHRVATYRTIDNSITKGNTIDNSTIDRALEETSDLITEQYKGWFANQVKRLGADRYMGLATDARRGNKPDRYFVWLLKAAR